MQNRRTIASGFLERLNEPGYRLQGENPSTATLEQARLWAGRYEDLVKFERELLELCDRYAERSEPEVTRAIRDMDLVLLETQVSRFQQRCDYWKIRATELSGNGRRGGHD